MANKVIARESQSGLQPTISLTDPHDERRNRIVPMAEAIFMRRASGCTPSAPG
jgi:hypothetical protein